jgi:hypothetical protein
MRNRMTYHCSLDQRPKHDCLACGALELAWDQPSKHITHQPHIKENLGTRGSSKPEEQGRLCFVLRVCDPGGLRWCSPRRPQTIPVYTRTDLCESISQQPSGPIVGEVREHKHGCPHREEDGQHCRADAPRNLAHRQLWFGPRCLACTGLVLLLICAPLPL